MRTCNKCGETKPLTEYYKQSKSTAKYKGHCKSCDQARNAEWRRNNPDKVRASWRKASKKLYTPEQRRHQTLSRYGLTVEEYELMYDTQNGVCSICHRPDDPLVVDHCHKTSKVRGLLCNKCNRGLGHFFDDSVLLGRAITYLNAE